MTQEVTFTTGTVITPKEGESAAIVISYANNQNHAVFINVSEKEARRRFTKRMNNRHPFEIEREGWEATIGMVAITDELWIEGTAGRDLQDLSNQLMQQMMGKQD